MQEESEFEIDLDTYSIQKLKKTLASMRPSLSNEGKGEKASNVYTLTVTPFPEYLAHIKAVLCMMRAYHKPAILLLKNPSLIEIDTKAEEIHLIFTQILETLYSYDQLFLYNGMTLLKEARKLIDYITPEYQKALDEESRIEMKCFREWIASLYDRRMNTLSPLPFRSFIRKLNTENYSFFLDLIREDSEPQQHIEIIKKFLLYKKQNILSLVPRRKKEKINLE